MSASPPEEWYLKFPERYRRHPKIKPIAVRKGWVHTTDWLFAILVEARQSRSAGALMIMGEPVTPENIGDLVEAWWPIEEEWVHVMVEAGLFSLCSETGAIIVECRRYFYGYDSDSPEANRERQAKCREKKRQEEALLSAVTTPSRQSNDSVTPTSRQRHANVTTPSRANHDDVTGVTTRSDQIRSNQNRSDHSIDLESDRAIERSSDASISELEAYRLQQVAQRAYEGFKPKPSQRFFTLCQDFLCKYAGSYGVDVACLALQHAGQATAWAQRHGPNGVAESSINSYAMQCAKNQLAPIADRERDRAYAKTQGLPDPGPLLWIPPDEEAMLA